MLRTRIALFAALALIAAACGGTSEGGDRPLSTAPITTTLASQATPDSPDASAGGATSGGGTVSSGGVRGRLAAVQLAMAQTAAEPPARTEGLIEISGLAADVGEIDISIPFSSSFDTVTGDGHMAMDFSAMSAVMGTEGLSPEMAGMFDRFEIRQVGDTAYMQFGLLAMMFGAETPWISMPSEDGAGFAQDFSTGINPYDATVFLESLSESGGEVSVIGTEDLRGAATTHYRAVFDLESLAALDPDGFAQLQESAPLGGGELPMDLWIDDQNRIHRYFFEITGPDVGELNPGESFDYMRVRFDFSDYGGRVSVSAPPSGEVTDMSQLENPFGGFGDLGEFSA